MAKKFALIIAVVLVFSCLFVLAGCDVENYDNFTPLTDNPSAGDPVSSNGGIAVEKGNYIYYINGWATYTSDNIFGQVLEGGILRILKSDLESVMASSAQKDVYDALQEKAQVVVPKIFSQGNTSDKSVTGFYIFGDRIYYFTPNAKLDKNGAARASEMCLNSCNLDGTDTLIHFTFSLRTTVTSLSYVGGKVYCTYLEGTDLFNVLLQGNGDKAQKILEECSSVLYDKSGAAFILNDDSTIIYKYVAGEDKAAELRNGTKNSAGEDKPLLDREKYALVNTYNGECFIKITGSTNTSLSAIYKIKGDNSFVKITSYVPTTFKGAGDYLFVLNTDNSISIVNFSDRTVAATEAYSSAPTLLYVKDNALYYTYSSKLYKLDIPSALGEQGEEKLKAVILASTSQYASSALEYDSCGGYVFLFNSTQDTNNKVYPLYVSRLDLEKETTKEYNVTRLTKRLFYLTADAGITNGSVSIKVGSSTVTNTIAGNTVTITVSPSSGYKLVAGSLKYNDTPLTETSTGNTYTFVMPQEHVTITAQFEMIDYSIDISPDIKGGTITVTKDGQAVTTAKKGDQITITVTPKEGYKIKEGSLIYDDTPLTPDANGVVTITMPASHITLSVEFELIDK